MGMLSSDLSDLELVWEMSYGSAQQVHIAPALLFPESSKGIAFSLLADAREQLKSMWDDYAARRPGRLLHGSTWRELRNDMLQRVDDLNDPPRTSEDYQWMHAWRSIEDKMKAADPSNDTLSTFREFLDVAYTDHDRHQYTLPCAWEEDWSSEEYCCSFWIKMLSQRNRRHFGAWQAAIENEQDDAVK